MSFIAREHAKKEWSSLISYFSSCFNIYYVFSAALTGLASKKWNDGTLDKYLKSPADYAPGKYLLTLTAKTHL